jgi:hypothetical protein
LETKGQKCYASTHPCPSCQAIQRSHRKQPYDLAAAGQKPTPT